jgi:Sortase domain
VAASTPRKRSISSTQSAGLVVLTTALLGIALLVSAFRSQEPAPETTVDRTDSSSSALRLPAPRDRVRSANRTHAGVEDRVTGPALPPANPVSVAIGRLGIVSRLEPLGIDDQGAMQVPDDPAEAGWYRLGPTPGALGPAVIAGHVTWNEVPGVFFRLAAMRSGDLVEVARDDGLVAVFEVTRVRLYDKTEFPTGAVFGPVDHAALRLITCGGEYQSSAHRYLGNVVVFARLQSSHRS